MEKEFVRNLKKILKTKNITQKKLTELLNTKESVVSHWISGKAYPSAKSIDKLSSVLNVPVSYFYTGKLNNENNSEPDLRDKEIALLKETVKRLDAEMELLKNRIEKIEKIKK